MRKNLRVWRTAGIATLAAATAGAIAVSMAPTANAGPSTSDRAAKIDSLIARAEASAGVTADSPDVAAKIKRAGDRVDVALSQGKTLTVTLPNTETKGQWSTTPKGISRAPQETDAVADVVEPAQDGVRVLSIINDKDAPSEYTYAVSLGAGSELKLDQKTGHGAVISADKKLGVAIAPAWAVDAKGAKVPTHYEIRDAKLVQVVEHAAGNYAYPIVADPKWNSRWFGGEVIFNHNETAAIAGGGVAAAGIVLGGCTFIPAPINAVCAALAVAAGTASAYFMAMKDGGKCGKIYVTVFPPPVSFAPAPGGQRPGDLGCPRR